MTNGEATNREATNREATNREATNREATNREATNGELAYAELLATVAGSLERLEPAQRLSKLYEIISPLLDQVAEQDSELYDDQVMSTPEAVQGFRRIGAGEALDAEAIHYHLTYFSLVESEDQDRNMHVRSQAAWLAAQWLQLKEGRPLPAVEDYFELDSLAGIANTLAWTRSRQIELNPQDASYGDLPAAIGELRALQAEING